MSRYSKKQLLKEFCVRQNLNWTEKMSTVELTNVVLQMKDKYVLANNEKNMYNVWVFMEYYLLKIRIKKCVFTLWVFKGP